MLYQRPRTCKKTSVSRGSSWLLLQKTKQKNISNKNYPQKFQSNAHLHSTELLPPVGGSAVGLKVGTFLWKQPKATADDTSISSAIDSASKAFRFVEGGKKQKESTASSFPRRRQRWMRGAIDVLSIYNRSIYWFRSVSSREP